MTSPTHDHSSYFPAPACQLRSDFTLLGDVGGQRTLRPYWRNYFEQTDALVWVVDSGDRMRMQDCKQELHSLLTEDVRSTTFPLERWFIYFLDYPGRISRPILALSRCISTCIGQQTGFARFDEWHRNSRRKSHFFLFRFSQSVLYVTPFHFRL